MRGNFDASFERQRAIEVLHKARSRPSMFARDETELEVVLRWLGVLASRERLEPNITPLRSPSPSRRWAAFAIGWLAEDLLPWDWLSLSRAAAIGRRAFWDANLTDSDFALLWTLLVMTGLDDVTGVVFQDRRIAALREFGDFCPTPSLRKKWIAEGTFVSRPFELVDRDGEAEERK
jgi:hypothetical protein